MSQRSHTVLPVLLAAIALSLVCPPARAQSAPLTLKDTAGTDHAVPAKDKPTLIFFLRPGQSQSDEALKLLPAILKDHPAQILLIVSGEDAPAAAARLAAATPLANPPAPYPIIS